MCKFIYNSYILCGKFSFAFLPLYFEFEFLRWSKRILKRFSRLLFIHEKLPSGRCSKSSKWVNPTLYWNEFLKTKLVISKDGSNCGDSTKLHNFYFLLSMPSHLTTPLKILRTDYLKTCTWWDKAGFAGKSGVQLDLQDALRTKSLFRK